MFCPSCGTPDQVAEAYCRHCGIFLPDPFKPARRRQSPDEHVKANIVLNSMTIVACLTMAVLLYVILGFRSNTHPLIYVTAGLLIAMACWHVQTLWRTILLRRHLKTSKPPEREELDDNDLDRRSLDEADFSDIVPPSVTDRTTRTLSERADPRSSQAKH